MQPPIRRNARRAGRLRDSHFYSVPAAAQLRQRIVSAAYRMSSSERPAERCLNVTISRRVGPDPMQRAVRSLPTPRHERAIARAGCDLAIGQIEVGLTDLEQPSRLDVFGEGAAGQTHEIEHVLAEVA